MRILVSGAGIAGSATALFLRAQGHEVTVIDRSPFFNRQGYVLALKHFGLGVMKSLGLFEELRARAIETRVIRVHDARGRLLQEYPAEPADTVTRGSLLLLRSDLHEVLSSALSRIAPVAIGTRIARLDLREHAATVSLSDGREESFDLVVVAEGLRSSTRRLLWGDHGMQAFGVIYAATMIDVDHGEPAGVYQLFLAPEASLILVPVGQRGLMIQCYFRGEKRPETAAAQVQDLLRKNCSRFPGRIRRLIDEVAEDADIFSDNVGMVTLPRLSRGSVLLVGDAGYCPTFLSGMGASLGLLGAKALDQALKEFPGDVSMALARYDTLMQPIVTHYQHDAEEKLDVVLSRNPLQERLHEWALRIIPPQVLVRHLRKQHEMESSALREFEWRETSDAS